jgi:hypothetical protein
MCTAMAKNWAYPLQWQRANTEWWNKKQTVNNDQF